MGERLYEVRSFVSREMDIEGTLKSGSPLYVQFENGEKARIHIVSVRAKKNGLYQFHGAIADREVEGFYGNDSNERPKKLLSGFGMVKL